jgi:two-component system, LuxR family, sensor kinase FixL
MCWCVDDRTARRPPCSRVRKAAHNRRVAFQEVFRVWRSAVLGALGILAVAVVTFVARRFHADSATAALLFLFVVVILSLSARLVPALIVSVVAISSLDFFFTPPLYRVRISETLDVVALVVFSTTALVVTRLMTTIRRSLQEIQAEVEERKRAQEILREQASLLDLTHDALFVRSEDDTITYWNRGAEELYGWKRDEALGKVTRRFLGTVFPTSLAEIESSVLRVGRWEGELVHTTRDGTRVTVASRWSTRRDAQGRRIATLETNNDITDRKRAEEAVRKAQADLAHAARVMTMGEMAASIAHEVNQPLSGVVINANASLRWLGAEPPDLEEAREATRRIIRDGKRASQVIARVRALSKKATTEKERLDLNAAIMEVVVLAQGEANRTRVTLRTAFAPDLPRVLCDRVQLQQVVLNLILNGIEAMSGIVDRQRELTVATHREDGDRARVVVTDCGVGLDPEQANQIFDAFYTTKRSGMGMGLSISRTIIENHGGRLWAVPNEGPGATFQFTV